MSNNNWAIIGDVHSQADKLKCALSYCKDHNLRPLLLGDVFDSQCSVSNSIDVYRLLTSAQQNLNAVILQSNHQNKLIRFLLGNPVNQTHGLSKTIQEFKEANIDSTELLPWLLAMPYVVLFKDNLDNEYRAAHAYIPSRISEILEETYSLDQGDYVEFREEDFYATQKIKTELNIQNPPIKTFKKLKERMIYGPTIHSEEEFKLRIPWWKKRTRRNWTIVVGHYGVIEINHENKFVVLDGNCGKEGGKLPLYHLNEKKLIMF